MIPILVVVQLTICGLIAWLSPLFDFYAAERERPLLVVSLLLVNFILHLWSLAILSKSPDSETSDGECLGRSSDASDSDRLDAHPRSRHLPVHLGRHRGDARISPFRYPPLAIATRTSRRTNQASSGFAAVAQTPASTRPCIAFTSPELQPSIQRHKLCFSAALVTPADIGNDSPADHEIVDSRVLILEHWA